MSTIDDRFAPLLGPDSVWRFGAASPHSGLAMPGDTTSFVSAIVTTPDSAAMRSLLAQRGQRRDVIWPVIWEPAFDGDEGCRALPIIFRLPLDDNARTPSLATLHGAAEELLLGAFGPSFRDLVGDRPGFSARLASPVPEGTIAALDATSVPAWTPDAELQNELSEGAPLAVVAVIDDGLPFAHECVRDSTGWKSRMEFCWLQGASAQAGLSDPGAPAVPHGREYLRQEIETLISRYGRDEDRLYREAGALEPRYEYGSTVNRFGTHGSHALGAAAGFRADDPAPPSVRDRLRVIGVQLAPPVTLDTTGQWRLSLILQAFNYVLERAERIRQGYGMTTLPLVINFSYGYTGGPHDGSGYLADAIRRLVAARVNAGQPTVVTLPAGNSFQNRLCGQITSAALRANKRVFTISWSIPPADRTGSVLQLWFAVAADLSTLSVDIQDPEGFLALAVPKGGCQNANQSFDIKDRSGADVGRLDGDWAGSRRCVAIRLLPSEPFDATASHARPGLWRVVLKVDHPSKLAGAVDCRILRDIDPVGYSQGAQQSYFDCGEPTRAEDGNWIEIDDPNGFLRRFGTLNDLAPTGGSAVVAGSCHEGGGTAASYSSAGLVSKRRHGAQAPSVTCAVTCESGRALPGAPGDGARSGSRFRLSGTSAASARLARELAFALLTRPLTPPAPSSDRIGPVRFSDVRGATKIVGRGPESRARLGNFLLE